MSNLKFINVEQLNTSTENHAFVYKDTYCVVDRKGDVAVYKQYYVQGNKNKSITDRLLINVENLITSNKSQHLPLRVELIPLLIMPDSPSRYV